MKRFHKEIYFPDTVKLKELTARLNNKFWKFSSHSLDNLKYRAMDNASILKHVRDTKLDEENIFEYYRLDEGIEKVCYRIPYSHSDIILVVSKDKTLVTVYLNSKNDNHVTLTQELYQQEEAI